MQVVALAPIRHDGRDYAVGELLEVGDGDGAVLVDGGAASPLIPTPLPSGASGKRVRATQAADRT